MNVAPGAALGQSEAGHPRWRRVAVGCAGGMFVGMGLGRFSYTAMVPALAAEGGIDAVIAGRIGMANLAGFMIGAAASVALARRLPRVGVLMAAVMVAVVGLAASAAPLGVLWLALCRGTLGIATGIIMVLSLALITEAAPADRRPLATGYMFVGVGLGILASGLLVPPLLALGLMAAWLGLAAVSLVGAALALWGWRAAPRGVVDPPPPVASNGFGRPLKALLVAHALFSLGIVPHSLYWVDFLVRGVGLGIAGGGLHWSLVGVLSILGPLLAAGLARLAGTAVALVVAFAALGLGLAAPALWPATAVLVASSLLFGAQPGLSSLMAARARDLAAVGGAGNVMRAMILANSAGSVAGGIVVPWAYGVTGSHAPLFLLAGAAMLIAALAASPAVAGSAGR